MSRLKHITQDLHSNLIAFNNEQDRLLKTLEQTNEVITQNSIDSIESREALVNLGAFNAVFMARTRNVHSSILALDEELFRIAAQQDKQSIKTDEEIGYSDKRLLNVTEFLKNRDNPATNNPEIENAYKDAEEQQQRPENLLAKVQEYNPDTPDRLITLQPIAEGWETIVNLTQEDGFTLNDDQKENGFGIQNRQGVKAEDLSDEYIYQTYKSDIDFHVKYCGDSKESEIRKFREALTGGESILRDSKPVLVKSDNESLLSKLPPEDQRDYTDHQYLKHREYKTGKIQHIFYNAVMFTMTQGSNPYSNEIETYVIQTNSGRMYALSVEWPETWPDLIRGDKT